MPSRYSFQDPATTSSTANIVSGSTTTLDSQAQPTGCLPIGNVGAVVKRQVGLLSGISLVIGTMIGSGIFASAKTVATRSGSVGMILLTWIDAGMIAMFGALSYSELGTAIPVSGGEYSYLMKGFGPIAAFMFSWVSIVVLKPSSISAICMACGDYITEAFFPADCSEMSITKNQIAKILASLAIGGYKYLHSSFPHDFHYFFQAHLLK